LLARIRGFCSSAQHPDWFWSLPSPLFNGFGRGPGWPGLSGWDMKLTTSNCCRGQKFMELYLIPAYIFMALLLIRCKDNFTLTFTMCGVKNFGLATLVTLYSLLFSILVCDGSNLQ
jgi:hypothetical protein